MDKYPVVKALLDIWDELPTLLGERWRDLKPRLQELLDQFQTADGEEARARISIVIQDLLEADYAPALDRLDEALAAMEPRRGLSSRRGTTFDELKVRMVRLLSRKTDAVKRYTDITMPRRLWIEEPRISVIVRLSVQPSALSAASEELAVQEDQPVRFRIDAPAFEVLGDLEAQTTILPEKDSSPVVFDLRPRKVGPTHVTLDFFQGGSPIGTASVPVEVTAYPVNAPEKSWKGAAFKFGQGAPPADRMLFISLDRFGEQPALTFTLMRAGEVGEKFSPVPLEANPQTWARRRYKHLLLLDRKLDPVAFDLAGKERKLNNAQVDQRAKKIGQKLWDDLIPEELKSLYAQRREDWRESTLLIVSDEPYYPWEMIWPYGEGWEDEAPWCMTLNLGRWLRRDFKGNGHEAAPGYLPFNDIVCLAPNDSCLVYARRERELLETIVSTHGLKDLSPSSSGWTEVEEMLANTAYGWLHIASHGSFAPQAPDMDSALWLEGGQALTPDAFVGSAIEGHIRERRPGFFFNACHTGQQGWKSTGLGGWANRLISKGAGFLLASLWPVADRLALRFAEKAYEVMLDGGTAAEAIRTGRLAVRESGNLTWLAYTLYAHPNARLIVG